VTLSIEHEQQRLVALGDVSELGRSKRSVVVVDGRELLVLNVRRRFTVLENRCPHLGLPLDDARIVGRTLVCSSHGYKYALADGAHIPGWRCPSAGAGRLELLPTRVDDGVLYAVLSPVGDAAA
jgi:nitrite reductase/ring-hydroxylating ferredoxin subunit